MLAVWSGLGCSWFTASYSILYTLGGVVLYGMYLCRCVCIYMCMHANMDICECYVVSNLHPANYCLSLVFVQRWRAQLAPPFEQHRVANELEPRREDEFRLLEHLLQFVRRHVPRIAHFVRVNVQINIGLDKKNIVDY